MADTVRNTYIYGNTVRWEEPYIEGNTAPAHAEAEPLALPRVKPVSETVTRNRERAQYVSIGYTVFLMAAAVLVILACVSYLQARSRLTSAKKLVNADMVLLQQMKSDNDAEEVNLSLSVDLNEIYHTATEIYGMIYPSDEQIIYYDSTDLTFVRQYEDIPTT